MHITGSVGVLHIWRRGPTGRPFQELGRWLHIGCLKSIWRAADAKAIYYAIRRAGIAVCMSVGAFMGEERCVGMEGGMQCSCPSSSPPLWCHRGCKLPPKTFISKRGVRGVSLHGHIYVCVCVHVCAFMCARFCTCIHTCIRTHHYRDVHVCDASMRIFVSRGDPGAIQSHPTPITC